MLEARRISVSYSLHRAVDDVSLDVGENEIVVILGANGAGKTSLLRSLAGTVPGSPGREIRLAGRSISSLPAHRIVEEGLALVPEGRGVFGELTVRENLMLGAYPRRAQSRERENLDRVLTLFPRLSERMRQLARTMSGGEQQMLAVARALMSAPIILLLDEPSLGLSPLVSKELFAALARVRETGVSILLVEQNALQGLALADRAYLLENGRIVGTGRAAELQRDPAIRRAYLGVGEAIDE
jgi:branched-chain amino acid transport system ATP-binding protein